MKRVLEQILNKNFGTKTLTKEAQHFKCFANISLKIIALIHLFVQAKKHEINS